MAADPAAPPDETATVEQIHDAVIEQRLPAGTKLSEASLYQVFAVRRARIRRNLLILASRNIIMLQPNRGAFFAYPMPTEARGIFEAGRAIEDTVVRLAALSAKPAAINWLTAHVAAEERAHAAHDLLRGLAVG